MKEISHTITCGELYKRIWTIPILQLAKEYGISDVGLAKICKRYSIPRPNLGYWQKLRAGQKVNKPVLPKAIAGKSVTIVGHIKERGDEKFDAQAFYSEAKPIIDAEFQRNNKIVVPKQVKSSDAIIRNTLNKLRQGHRDKYHRIQAAGPGLLDVRVSKENIERAMRIIAALADALMNRKFNMSASSQRFFPWITRIHVLDEIVSFRLVEKISRRLYNASKDQERYALHIRISGGPPKYVFEPNGKLALQITNAPLGYAIGVEFVDSERNPLENQLNAFIANVIKTAVALKHIEREQEKDRQNKIEQEQQRQERLHQEQIARERIAKEERREKEKVDRLVHQAENRRKSKEIIELIHEVRAKWLELTGSINPGSEIEIWMEWAMHQAKALDPLSGGWPWQRSYESDSSI